MGHSAYVIVLSSMIQPNISTAYLSYQQMTYLPEIKVKKNLRCGQCAAGLTDGPRRGRVIEGRRELGKKSAT